MADGESGTVPAFADTSALYARVDEEDAHHATTQTVFDGIRTGELPYRPVYVTSHVLGELATLTMIRLDAATARTAIERLQASDLVTIVHPDADTFATASTAFTDNQDPEIALIDQLTAAAARDRGVSHVFAFDSDFRDLELTLIPSDVDGAQRE